MRDLSVHVLYLEEVSFLQLVSKKITYFAYHDGYEQFRICCFVTGAKGSLVRGSSTCAGSIPGMLG